jgi:hypothetical protein
VYQIAPVAPTCVRNGGTVTLSWIAPANSGTSTVTYRVLDAIDTTIVITPSAQTPLSVSLVANDVSGSSGGVVIQAHENQFGTDSVSAPIVVYVKGVLRCP